MRKIKSGDEVIVLAGKSKGAKGKLLKVVNDQRVIVEGVNLVKKHTKPDPNRGIQGGIVEQEAALHISNVAIYNTKTEKADRVGFRIEDGRKQRFYKSTGDLVDA